MFLSLSLSRKLSQKKERKYCMRNETTTVFLFFIL